MKLLRTRSRRKKIAYHHDTQQSRARRTAVSMSFWLHQITHHGPGTARNDLVWPREGVIIRSVCSDYYYYSSRAMYRRFCFLKIGKKGWWYKLPCVRTALPDSPGESDDLCRVLLRRWRSSYAVAGCWACGCGVREKGAYLSIDRSICCIYPKKLRNFG